MNKITPSNISKTNPKDAGAPRTVSPSDAELVELGKDMVAWIKANKATCFSEWYSCEKMIPRNVWKTMIQRPEFVPYYEHSMNIIAKRYREGLVHPSIAHRFLALYHQVCASTKEGWQRLHITFSTELRNLGKKILTRLT